MSALPIERNRTFDLKVMALSKWPKFGKVGVVNNFSNAIAKKKSPNGMRGCRNVYTPYDMTKQEPNGHKTIH